MIHEQEFIELKKKEREGIVARDLLDSLKIRGKKLKSVYLIATRDLSNLWLQFFLSQNQGFMRLFEKTVLK